MYVQNRNIIIVCEGASEKAYIQELNRYLEEEDIPLHFIPRPSNGGQFSPVVKKYREGRFGFGAASVAANALAAGGRIPTKEDFFMTTILPQHICSTSIALHR